MENFYCVNIKSKLGQIILYSLGWKLCFKADTNRKKDSFDHFDKIFVNPVKRELTGGKVEHLLKKVNTKKQIKKENTLMEKLAKRIYSDN